MDKNTEINGGKRIIEGEKQPLTADGTKTVKWRHSFGNVLERFNKV